MTETAIPEFPFATASEADRWAQIARRRAECPFGKVRLASGHEAVQLMRYEDVAAAFADPRLSHNLSAPGSPRIVLGPSFLDFPNSLLNSDGDDHRRLRRIVAATFMPRRVQKWIPTIEAIAIELLDRWNQNGTAGSRADKSSAGADLVSGYCYPLTMRVICQLLGMPDSDALRFQTWSNALLMAAKMPPEERLRRVAEFMQYMTELIAKRRLEPGTALIDDLIAARDGNDSLTENELVRLSMGLIAAGYETTSTALASSVVTLLSNGRILWERLRRSPELLPTAVDELLRYSATGNGLLRIAVDDVELPGGTVHGGEAVVISYASANRDETVYPNPDDVRFDRDCPPQITFGAGPHYCLGAHLAKAELRIGLGLLLRRLPDLHLAVAPDQLAYTEGDVLSSVVALPVSW